MANKSALLTPGARGDWRTPKEFYENLDKRFKFDFDPCPANPTFDGLAVNWGERNYVNPPYGRGVDRWLLKALQECENRDSMSLFLLPARTDTRWWHDLVMPNFTMLGFVKGRLNFDDGTAPAPFPCVLIQFGYGVHGPYDAQQGLYGVHAFDCHGNLLP